MLFWNNVIPLSVRNAKMAASMRTIATFIMDIFPPIVKFYYYIFIIDIDESILSSFEMAYFEIFLLGTIGISFLFDIFL